MNESPMSEEFNEWLDKCPVTWIRDKVDKDWVKYCFETPEKKEKHIVDLKGIVINEDELDDTRIIILRNGCEDDLEFTRDDLVTILSSLLKSNC